MSGLSIKKDFAKYDTESKLKIKIKKGKENKNCMCGDVLKGKILPSECPLFSKVCKPMNPIGPCMVSSEGSCAAYYKYSSS
jgi:hydrogenase expression/formation protein HypD